MSIRSLIVVFVLAGVAQSTAAQAKRVDVREHPDASMEVLWSEPASSRMGIFRSTSDLVFASPDGVRRVSLAGTVMAHAVSASGSRIAVLLKDAPDGPLQLRLFAQDGTPEAMHELPHHADDPLPQVALSDAPGEFVYTRPATADVCFVHDDESDCVHLYKDAEYAHERNVFIDVGPDGRHVAVAAQREPAHPRLSGADPNAHLFLFDRRGTLLWTRPLPQPAVQALAFTPEPGIIVSTYDAYAEPEVLHHSRLVALDGGTVADAPHGADAFAFGDEEIFLVTARRVAAVNARNRTSRLVHGVDSDRQLISVAAGVGRAAVVLLTGRRTFNDGGLAFEGLTLMHLDEAGVPFAVDDVAAPPQRAPRVEADRARGRTAVILDGRTHLYSWPR